MQNTDLLPNPLTSFHPHPIPNIKKKVSLYTGDRDVGLWLRVLIYFILKLSLNQGVCSIKATSTSKTAKGKRTSLER